MSVRSKEHDEKEMTVDEAFEYLDGVLEKLGADDISLEDSFRLYENGMKVLRECSGKIDTVEKKVLKLNENGGVEEFGI